MTTKLNVSHKIEGMTTERILENITEVFCVSHLIHPSPHTS